MTGQISTAILLLVLGGFRFLDRPLFDVCLSSNYLFYVCLIVIVCFVFFSFNFCWKIINLDCVQATLDFGSNFASSVANTRGDPVSGRCCNGFQSTRTKTVRSAILTTAIYIPTTLFLPYICNCNVHKVREIVDVKICYKF